MTNLGEGILNKPEDVVIDREGALITATRDGWIKKMHTNGTWEFWKFLASDSMLGITTSSTPGHFIVCDAANVRHCLNHFGILSPLFGEFIGNSPV